MVVISELLPDLRRLVEELNEDLIARSIADTAIDIGLRQAFKQIEEGGRTAQAFEVWREDYLDQVAVAWVLACVFVRFMEDNHLIDECWLAGEGERRRLAEDTHTLFFREHAHDTDREYFQHVFYEVGKIPAAKDLFAEGKTPLWAVAPSGDAAMKLLKFWREMEAATGHLKRSFQVKSGDTRFLGDLYQELSERAKKKFALLQTPVFVEEFILDRTLTPALAEFELERVRMIDPTCGSGHFLLGGFARLFDLWSIPDHTTGNVEKDAQKALDGVWGVDINPFAVAIARFRLIAAAIQACGIKRLKAAPGWNIHLASGDSLLFGSTSGFGGARLAIAQQMSLFDIPAIYATEDRKALQEVLGQGYHVVVGNPPYITVKDSAQNDAYRDLYRTCYRQYSLGVPFTQRFWELAIQKSEDGAQGAGHIGMITSNSFMKREFGKRLIEDFLPNVDLTHVIDTSGAYIPGHGTPTVILLGRSQKPVTQTVRAVLGIRGEPSTPEDAAEGLVWQSIVRHIDRKGDKDEFVSTADVLRSVLNCHPWSIGGGGAAELKDQIVASAATTLADVIVDIGRTTHTGNDDAFVLPLDVLVRHNLVEFAVPMAIGEDVRDWSATTQQFTLFPYDQKTAEPIEINSPDWIHHFWLLRVLLKSRKDFGNYIEDRGLRWMDHSMFFPTRFKARLVINFAVVATNNHFALVRGVRANNPHALIIRLPDDATEDDYLALIGLLNSSTGCFWMQQTLHNKGGPGGGSSKDEKWHDFYEFSGTAMQRFPVTVEKPLDVSRKLDALARQFSSSLPSAMSQLTIVSVGALTDARHRAASLRNQMIAMQEELDWQSYRLYGLISQNVCCKSEYLPEVALGERAFEIGMARRMQRGEFATKWFEWLRIKPTTDIPSHWPAAYQELVERRITLIETNNEIALIEKPECKRRWESEPWAEQEQRALRSCLLDRLETPKYQKGTKESPELTTTAQMTDVASADADFLQLAALYRGRPDFDVALLVAELVEGEVVPFLPPLRHTLLGLRKHAVWERTWDLQRQQDAGKDVGEIPLPPKYTTADFMTTDYWRLRGKLNVPKELWISYPHCSTESDPTLLVGWAGWNHLEQATALVSYYDSRKREGWDAKRLTPLLAGLDQLLPWIHQWHTEIDPEFGETAGQSYQALLESDAHELGLTLEEIRNWKPPEKARKEKKGRKKTVEAEVEE